MWILCSYQMIKCDQIVLSKYYLNPRSYDMDILKILRFDIGVSKWSVGTAALKLKI